MGGGESEECYMRGVNCGVLEGGGFWLALDWYGYCGEGEGL
jgi:hypothetical protein